jgi:hypothetical protein
LTSFPKTIYVDVEVDSLSTDYEHEHEHGLPRETLTSFSKTSHSVAFVDEVESLSDYEHEHEHGLPQETLTSFPKTSHSVAFVDDGMDSLIRKYHIC